MEGFVRGWLLLSLLVVGCVTVAFSANMIMVQDRVKGVRGDLTIFKKICLRVRESLWQRDQIRELGGNAGPGCLALKDE